MRQAARAVLGFVSRQSFVVSLLVTVAIASLLPARGGFTVVVDHATTVAIGLLFFLYGARLSPRDAWEGLRHWRLHLTVVVATFVVFPLLGLAGHLLAPTVLTPELAAGLTFLCCLPSTVQSSIAFTSVARGNVAAAICAASFSNLLGIIASPLLVALLLATRGGFSGQAVLDVALQLLLPFLLGQLARPWIADFVARHRTVLGFVDRGSILLVVYSAFGEGVVDGVWHRVSATSLLALVGVEIVLLGLVLVLTWYAGRAVGLPREDQITIMFCGSKKSLASGLPMAGVLFAGPVVGLIVLPLMLYHQLQLMVCAALAQRLGRGATTPDSRPARGEPAPAAT
ncbi:bile acid:sodium symporter [Actinomycetospora endophytica]|uniref:Bile acid:sodium symporter n=1 Tax=Actinomycetospora endophytica TaxID=2291215 RepID=A0ABS8PBM8_9PSEU|nr:bile acid:sodium symporter family protein [Actinomycetospora endophytica]MCD2195668.1 bile acid:sodium symporter [Actinomycetospora endophytica]